MAYKPEVDDMRESPTFKIMDLLEKYVALIVYYDPHILKIKPTREHAERTGMESVTWSREEIVALDGVIPLTVLLLRQIIHLLLQISKPVEHLYYRYPQCDERLCS